MSTNDTDEVSVYVTLELSVPSARVDAIKHFCKQYHLGRARARCLNDGVTWDEAAEGQEWEACIGESFPEVMADLFYMAVYWELLEKCGVIAGEYHGHKEKPQAFMPPDTHR